MAHLGSGAGTSYPQAIDSRQTWINSPLASPDSASRLDAEMANDLAATLVAIETSLGANPQGVFGSVAARLQQFLPGGGTTPLFFTFATQTSVTITGNVHRLGTSNILVQVYDLSVPRVALLPAAVTIDTLTYNVVVTFATPQSGVICLAAAAPQYTTTFTNQTSVGIAGSTHQLGTGALLVNVYTVSGLVNFLTPAQVTVHPTTYDVLVTFATPQSGSIMLSAAGPRYVHTFTNSTLVTIPGSTHGLGSEALLFEVYNNATPAGIIGFNTLTVDPSNYTVQLTFATPQSGFIVLTKATVITGTDFQIRDGGVTDSTAVRVLSEAGRLILQMGIGNALQVRNKTGTVRATLTDAGNLGLGTTTPAQQLELTGNAAKPGGGQWLSSSDARVKEVLRPFLDGLALVQQLDPVWYRYLGLGGMPDDRLERQERVGLVAQALQDIAPYMLGRYSAPIRPGEAATELLSVDSTALIYILLNAVKELAARLALVEAALGQTEEPQA